ncbi:hypothetical protein NX059_001427 [Plenodomus lindquistii]|nr:hypothetical protein NX059_001427 [Plenodomus lindquistii]
MNAARQACRPKHQVLVLKCYPKFSKAPAPARANSSELSYLLYYASTRRSKLHKVCAFLDKRATKDVWKNSTGSVAVTLQIVKALVDKCPRDLPLYGDAVLRILRTILGSGDVGMVEDTVPVFEALCRHQEPAALAADAEYKKLYEDVVSAYAQFARKETVAGGKTPVSWPVAIRYRKAGLTALKAVASSESLAAETGRQMQLLIPVIMLNVYSEDGAHLKRLQAREAEQGEHDKDLALKRRQSASTAKTDEEEGGDAVAASGTTEDADKLAEEEVGVLAVQALRNIFQGGNRGLLRFATSAVLDFIATKVKAPHHAQGGSTSWATTLMATICSWAPVQDRYTILVGIVEALVRSPIVEDDLERQLVLAAVIDHLLASAINFIGLSVMDVLVGLISHTLLLLQLGGPGSSIHPHHQQTTAVFNSEKEPGSQNSSGDASDVILEVVQKPSDARVQLLELVQKSMADLATHVYYTDQVSDMVEAILSRLKPSRLSSISSTADAIQNPEGAIDAVADSITMQEKTYVDRFFSFETARITGLESVKAIINTANARRPDGSSASVARSRVGVSVWEGTQWLLRDPSGRVRKAYVDALITWLDSEKKKQDLKIVDNYRKKEKEGEKGALARRAVSNASQRERAPKKGRDTFLSLLHLAVYENALFYVDSEADFLLMHLLLTTLVNRLGVNAARTGLPMIMRLQEDIATVDDPGAKVRLGSLVHGYLWALSMAFDFETTSVGRALHNEITRRNNKGLWVKSIRVPPMPIDLISTPHPSAFNLPNDIVENEALKPFDNREALVEKLADGYASSLHSPPSSPPGSPGRSLSNSSGMHTIPAIHQPDAHVPNPIDVPTLSYKVREDLLSEWSRDACLADNAKDSSSASISGSRSGTQYTATQRNNYLGVSIPNGGIDSGSNSPSPGPTPRRAQSRPPTAAAYGLVGTPGRSRSPGGDLGSSSSVRSTVRVDDLRRALSTSHGGPPRTSGGFSMRAASQRRKAGSESGAESDSMISVHSLSDASFLTSDHANPRASIISEGPETPAATVTPRPGTANTLATGEGDGYVGATQANGVPPVPPIPNALRDSAGTSPGLDFGFKDQQDGGSPTHETTAVQSDTRDFAARPTMGQQGNGNGNDSTTVKKSRSVKSGISRRGRSGERKVARTSLVGGSVEKPDFTRFLDSIGGDSGDDDETGEEGGVNGVGSAPY